MDAIAAKALLQHYLEGNATPEEIMIIERWYQQLAETGDWTWEYGEKEQLQAALEGRILGQIAADAQAGIQADLPTADKRPARIVPLRRMAWAAVLLAAIAGAWLLLSRRTPPPLASVKERYHNDVDPGRNAAVLTLAGGKTVVLDDSAPRSIGRQGGTEILNKDGQLVYEALKGEPSETFYNTLTTQKGNIYHLTLPDGTKVWLNAASSITYPTAFTGKERRVSISGEAYFEVMKNQDKPFVVQQGDKTVQVLGTSFDVNAYGDGAAWKTTLLEGKVRVVSRSASGLLAPGEQAVIGNDDDRVAIVNDPDVEAVMAWKNGNFAFKDADIESVMQQAARWYDVQVIYEARPAFHVVAEVPRAVPLSELLKLLEATDQVHFRIEGKKVYVMK